MSIKRESIEIPETEEYGFKLVCKYVRHKILDGGEYMFIKEFNPSSEDMFRRLQSSNNS